MPPAALPGTPAARGEGLPSATRHPVHRQTLCDRVLRSPALLVLLTAPPGFGKSMSMAQLREAFAAAGLRTAWLTLGRGDNDPQRFVAFLRQHLPEIDAVGNVAPFSVAAATGAPVALFLDDFDAAAGGAVPHIVRDLLDQLPRGSRVVIGAHQQPGFGLARLRAQGLVLNLGMQDLRFDHDEARQLLCGQGDGSLSDADIELLQQRTEGWPAALALASMAMADQPGSPGFILRFSGTSQSLADYLSQVVLDRQPAPCRAFLLATSLLQELELPACAALLPALDCDAILARVRATNLFVSPVAGRTNRWRYHGLFTDFLRAQLQREQPGDFRRLHRVASAWFASNARISAAIDHAMAGDDHPRAARLLADHGQRFLAEGRLRLLSRWFAAMPPTLLTGQQGLLSVLLWTITFTQGAAEAQRLLSLHSRADANRPGPHDPWLALRCAWLMMQDRLEEAYVVGQQALARLPTAEPYADNVLSVSMATLMAQRGEREQSHRLLDAARLRQGDARFMRMYIETAAGEQDLLDGLLRQATARFRIAVGASRQALQPTPDLAGGNAYAGVLYAVACHECDELTQARRLLLAYLPMVQSTGLHEHLILSQVCLSRMARAQGQGDDADAHLDALEQAGITRQLPRLVTSAWLERARVRILQGEAGLASHALARAEQAQAGAPARSLRRIAQSDLDLTLTHLRWALHFGDARRALMDIDAELAAARAASWPLRALTLQLLRAAALVRVGQPAQADAQMRAVLGLTAEQGFVRRVLNEGPLVMACVERLRLQLEPGFDEPLLWAHVQRLRLAAGPMASPVHSARTPPGISGGLLDPLTPKELRALHLIAEGLSNADIALRLGVSANTVRAHLRSINSKLAVNSRMQAVARARNLCLLPG